jgi:hypothetical protein
MKQGRALKARVNPLATNALGLNSSLDEGGTLLAPQLPASRTPNALSPGQTDRSSLQKGRVNPAAGIAQLVEQLICNQQVIGSSPIAGCRHPTKSKKGSTASSVLRIRVYKRISITFSCLKVALFSRLLAPLGAL